MINESYLAELLRTATGGYLHHREGRELEFTSQFKLAGLADYYRDFSAFANSRGGYLIFGLTDTPRKLNGLSEASLDQFNKIGLEKITGFLLEIFSGSISWEQINFEFKEKNFGIFRIHPAAIKPVIAKMMKARIKSSRTVKEGEFVEKKGAAALKLISDVVPMVPIDMVDIVKKAKENLIKNCPLTAIELIQEVKKQLPDCR